MTEQLTSAQLATLGHHFLAYAQAVGNYRYTKKLSPALNKSLSELQWTLLNYSDDLYTSSARLAMNDVKKSLAIIKQLTKKMQESYQQIRTVQQAIDVATATVTLGAALFSFHPLAIDAAIEKLAKAL